MRDDELLATIFGNETGPLREACAGWMSAARLFRAFVEENAGKIRKKARQAGEPESLRDLQLEMATAVSLLVDRRVSLAYERYLSGKTRGPDFTVTYKGHITFNVEVRRLRAPIAPGKLDEVLCEKLRQMPPSTCNVLLIGVDARATADLDVDAARKRLLQRAEAKQEDYFADRGYADAREFLRALQRLSGVLVHVGWEDPTSASVSLWLNPQAKHPLPADAQKLLRT